MAFAIAALVVLWFLLGRPKPGGRWTVRSPDRLVKLGASALVLLAAAVVFLRGHIEVALLLLGAGVWLYNLAGRTREAAPAAPRRARSTTVEMEHDPASGAMRGTVLAGPYAGRPLDGLALAQCREVLALCRTRDPAGARLLEAYLDRRSAGWRQAGEGDRDAWRTRPRRPGGMTEDEAYEVLGLARAAGREEIVRAHRTLMKKLHPDQGGSTDLAARVNEAKEVLTRGHG